MMTPWGQVAAISHLIVHAVMKICGFFCVGAVMHQTGRNYVAELEGLAKKMPVIFGCFTVAGISLAGIPPFGGFISKWNIATAAVLSEHPMALAAVGVLLYSAFMTALYMGLMLFAAWFPRKERNLSLTEKDCDPGWRMKLPIIIFACIVLCLGLFARPVMKLIEAVAFGLI